MDSMTDLTERLRDYATWHNIHAYVRNHIAEAATTLETLTVGEGGVTQADRDAAADYFELIGEANRAIVTRRGQYDLSACVQAFARHRQAAEKAQQERDAGIADAHRQARIEAAKNAHSRKVKAEARDHESMAIEALHIATAIRSQGHE